jgi:hypothetical protein
MMAKQSLKFSSGWRCANSFMAYVRVMSLGAGAGVLAHPTPMLINPDDYLPASTAAKEFGCGSGVDAGPGYGEVLELLKNATGPAMLAPYPVYTKHFSWRNR